MSIFVCISKSTRRRSRGRSTKMEKIEHTTVSTNGINMHVASIGTGPAILFLHGFPELWYSWRHQLLSLSALGYRAIAPDLRGYGDSDAPPAVSSYSVLHLVGLLDALGLDRVFLVGHDWGAIIAWHLCLLRPDRIKALVNTSVAFSPRNPKMKPVSGFRAAYGDNFYICKFQKPGQVEEELSRIDTAKIITAFLTSRDPRPFIIPKDTGFEGMRNRSMSLPCWLTEEDINYYASKFNEKGFTGGLNYYRAMDLNWELMAPWTGAQIKVPVKFIIGDQDMTYNLHGAKDYMHGGGFKRDVPFLQEVVILEGVGHFLNQEKADEVSSHIYDFINKF